MRVMSGFAALLVVLGPTVTLAACGTGPHQASAASPPRVQSPQQRPSASPPHPAASTSHPVRRARPARSTAASDGQQAPAALPAPGNPSGHATVPAAGQPVDTSHPAHVIGTGTPASCTSAAVVAAGGIITFSCGPAPVTITMQATAKVVNTSADVVLDGGGKVTLSGGGVRRILYMDTCDPAQHWTTSHCQDQPEPVLTVQNLAFTDGNSTGQTYDGGGGGAIFFVSDNNTGTLAIQDSTLHDNPSEGFETPGYPGIFFHSAGHPTVTGSTLS